MKTTKSLPLTLVRTAIIKRTSITHAGKAVEKREYLCIVGRFPGGSAGKESACNMGDLGSIRGLGRSPDEGNSYPLQYSGLENSMNCIVHGVTKSQT